ncbi:uncharacterized protein LOC101853644 [Aplysia californica]|uniref:Uncharacterized protein LOC101853644 n=1 Tax=Aplysia californica TaxID=6500 RepID=A0ABM0K400_APLCA|nr:uncharacterized protein LOC101853644 [Aplysia californica]
MTLFLVFSAVSTSILFWLLAQWLPHKLTTVKVPRIYTQPSFHYPIKYWIFRLVLWTRKICQNQLRLRRQQASSSDAGYGVKSRNSPEEMDKLQELPQDMPKAVDAVYINGGNSEGVFMVTATARRQDNFVQTVLYLRIPSIGLLEMPTLPDTWLQDTASRSGFSGGGLTLTPISPMESWSITFDGTMRIAETGKSVKVDFNLIWKAYTKCFDFDTDLHPHVMADGIARETWSREYFDTLKRAHQTHYEQFGEVSGILHIDGHPDQRIRVQGVRDHSYGNIRDWKYFHRYALNYAHLEDGSALCVGAICMPMSLSRLVVGYFFHPDGSMDAVSETDFEFYNWGEDGQPPEKLSLKFTAGGQKYDLTCEVIQCPIFYMGEDWDARIFERFCNYTVNGIRGWGISEWDYRNYDGKEVELTQRKS